MSNNHNESKDKMPSKMADRIEHTLLEARRIFISDAVDSRSASDIIRKLWFLELTHPGKPILFVINSPGGSVDSGFAIWDQVQMITSPVTTLITGLAASMGSVLSLCASPKRRFATPHSRIMIHQPLISGIIKGQATDLEIQAREMLKTHQMLIELYSVHTGLSKEVIEKMMNRDNWMTAQEALALKLLDGIVSSFSELDF